jgi:DNA invertase Pin-like site-specific DNA recombinase
MPNALRRVALYCRVSTNDQTTDNQLLELRSYCAARGWTIGEEFVDEGISGSATSRPALDRLLKAARRRQIDAVVTWKLDRLGRSLQHLIALLDEITSLGVVFVSLGESIDLSTSAGRLQMHLLSAFAEFERERIRERVRLGISRARAQGKRLGRRRNAPLPAKAPKGLTVRQAAKLWGCSKSQAARRLTAGEVPSASAAADVA